MAGILNKKDRLIDYKLTEHGRRQLMSGDIRFKYYTFSDRSIFYETNNIEGRKISDSEFYYLPFEVTTDPGLYVNPEYYLSSELTFDNADDNIFNLRTTQKTLSETLESKKYLSVQKIINSGGLEKNENFVFERIKTQDTIDFLNQTNSRRYPTVVSLVENVSNLNKVKKDKRFSGFLKNKLLKPINTDGSDIVSGEEEKPYKNSLDFIFKTLDIKSNIQSGDDRDSAVIKAINLLNKNQDKVFAFDYTLNKNFLTSNDIFSFELHEIKNEKLKKLSFVNLGEFFDKSSNNYKSVYLIGKFINETRVENMLNRENNTENRNVLSNYYFINMFTLVVE
jgi:hypothetical protein